MQFRIIESEGINYEQAKKDYMNGLHGQKFRDKYNLGTSAYVGLLKQFREDGVCIYNNKMDAKYYYYNKKNDSYDVRRRIGGNGNMKHFGSYKTEIEAINRVDELNKNNWEGFIL